MDWAGPEALEPTPAAELGAVSPALPCLATPLIIFIPLLLGLLFCDPI